MNDIKTTQAKETMQELRSSLIDSVSLREVRCEVAGISTAVLEGGKGQDLVLLHGPGENSFWWMRLFPHIVDKYRVLAPDLPGHAGSRISPAALTTDAVLEWLDQSIEDFCTGPPVIIGHVLGGAIGARFAIENSHKIDQLILVDSLGLSAFRPSLGFAFQLLRFAFRPTKSNSLRFLSHCLYDIDRVRNEMGDDWSNFFQYNLLCAQDPEHKEGMQSLMKHMGIPKIPKSQLNNISAPTTMIWGRYDLANSVNNAEKVSEDLGWPLHILEGARDDPKMERPEAFAKVLERILTPGGVTSSLAKGK